MMNKKGQNLIFAILIGVMIFMAGMLFLNQVMNDVTLTRTIGIDCSSNNISDGTKVTCIGIDLVIPILIIAIVSTAMGSILSRFLV